MTIDPNILEITRLQRERDEARTELSLLKTSIVEPIRRLVDELAEHYPVAITARVMCSDQATESDLREIIDEHLNAGPLTRLAALPARLAKDVTAIDALLGKEAICG